MTTGEWGLLIGIIAHSVAVMVALIKLVAWVTTQMTITSQKLQMLEAQVNNDVTGRRVVGEMKEDIATIKAQVSDLRSDIQYIHDHGS